MYVCMYMYIYIRWEYPQSYQRDMYNYIYICTHNVYIYICTHNVYIYIYEINLYNSFVALIKMCCACLCLSIFFCVCLNHRNVGRLVQLWFKMSVVVRAGSICLCLLERIRCGCLNAIESATNKKEHAREVERKLVNLGGWKMMETPTTNGWHQRQTVSGSLFSWGLQQRLISRTILWPSNRTDCIKSFSVLSLANRHSP